MQKLSKLAGRLEHEASKLLSTLQIDHTSPLQGEPLKELSVRFNHNIVLQTQSWPLS
jgi:hypothetical protein